jgi:D-beta-D-heptose 7-phosphate kinase/D-beta-D-heptose 1-phosphate adenosyltransferase
MTRPSRQAHSKLTELSPLLEELHEQRRRGRKLVFTNGCFDLLHAGHLHLLETAAALGELLVVGLNLDASVRGLKGAGRPFVPFADRAHLLAGLEVVDWVVGFDEETPLRLIEALTPEVLVKGEDWSDDRIVGREWVERHGGRVVRVPLLPRRSTNDLLERIRDRARGEASE